MAITSVLELGKHKIGDAPYYITFHNKNNIDLSYHPYRAILLNKKRPPRINGGYLVLLYELLSSDIIVSQHIISKIERDQSGEYIYLDDNGVSIPEYALFDSKQAAKTERLRIIRSIYSWSKNKL